MSADNVKWQVNKAVRASNLPSAARLVMLVLSDMAEAKEGYIPAKHSPSLSELARQTALGESTVKAQLTVLEELGWVRRTRPSGAERARHQQTYYQLAVGSPGDERPALKRKPRARSKPLDEVSEGQDRAIETANKGGSDSQEQALGEGQEMALESESEGQELATRGPGASSSRARSKPSYLKDDDQYDHNDSSFGLNADASAPRSGPKKRTRKPKADAPPRADVDALCQRLAELMIRNECKPPEITKTWRDEARRMLDIDKRPFDKAMALLEWCQNDSFWKSNIHSMPKFRTQYDQLRQRANAEWERERGSKAVNGYQPYRNDATRNYHGSI